MSKKPKWSRWKKLPRETIKKLYLTKSLSTYQIAKKFDCSPATIQNLLREEGVKLRRPGHRLKKTVLIPKEKWKLHYLAGIIDGEGAIKLQKSRGSRHGAHPRLWVKNTDKKLVEWLHKTFGGHMNFERRLRTKWSDIWIWSVHSTFDLTQLLPLVLPYLIVKREDAEKVLEFCKRRLENSGYRLGRFKEARE